MVLVTTGYQIEQLCVCVCVCVCVCGGGGEWIGGWNIMYNTRLLTTPQLVAYVHVQE